MEPTYAEAQQAFADASALRTLWISLIPVCAPTFDTAHAWLQRLSFFEVAKCIHATQRLYRKYSGKLAPWQLIKYMQQCMTKALEEKYGTDSK